LRVAQATRAPRRRGRLPRHVPILPDTWNSVGGPGDPVKASVGAQVSADARDTVARSGPGQMAGMKPVAGSTHPGSGHPPDSDARVRRPALAIAYLKNRKDGPVTSGACRRAARSSSARPSDGRLVAHPEQGRPRRRTGKLRRTLGASPAGSRDATSTTEALSIAVDGLRSGTAMRSSPATRSTPAMLGQLRQQGHRRRHRSGGSTGIAVRRSRWPRHGARGLSHVSWVFGALAPKPLSRSRRAC